MHVKITDEELATQSEAWLNCVPLYEMNRHEAAAYVRYLRERFDRISLSGVELVAFDYFDGHPTAVVGVQFYDGTRYER